jgi:hypothetical protein
MQSVYELERYDYTIFRGDTLNIPLEVVDPNGAPVTLYNYNIKFALRNSITKALSVIKQYSPLAGNAITHYNSQQYHPGAGIHIYDPTTISILRYWPELSIGTDVSKMQIILDAADTQALSCGVYRFDVELSYLGIDNKTHRHTICSGTVSVVEDAVANV